MSGPNADGYPSAWLLQAYVDAVIIAGGAPVLLPSGLCAIDWRGVYDRLDAVLFTGGGDIEISRSHGEIHEKVALVDPQRDELELVLLREAINDRKPFLGICRGCQIVNVGLGGSLYTHIEDHFENAIKHDFMPGWPRNHIAHEVVIKAESTLKRIVTLAELAVNSLHHQGIKTLGKRLIPSAIAPDGLVEAIELEGHPFGLAVQWHPEWLLDKPESRALFQAFIIAAKSTRVE